MAVRAHPARRHRFARAVRRFDLALQEKARKTEFSRAFVLVGTFALAAAVIALDVLTGKEISLSPFYVVPVMIGAWYGRQRVAFGVAIFGAAAWIALMSWRFEYAHPIIPWMNAIALVVIDVLIAVVLVQLRAALEREETLARTDPLTGAANGRTFYELADRELHRARRTERPFTVAFMDVDNFKTMNDQYGHLVGDQVLREVVTVMQNNLRTIDVVARMGGDEFALLLPETDGPGAEVSLQKVREALLAAMRRHQWPVTVSIGAITFEEPPEDVASIIRRTDALMYDAKRAGKDRLFHRITMPEAVGEQ